MEKAKATTKTARSIRVIVSTLQIFSCNSRIAGKGFFLFQCLARLFWHPSVCWSVCLFNCFNQDFSFSWRDLCCNMSSLRTWKHGTHHLTIIDCLITLATFIVTANSAAVLRTCTRAVYTNLLRESTLSPPMLLHFLLHPPTRAAFNVHHPSCRSASIFTASIGSCGLQSCGHTTGQMLPTSSS